MPRAVRLDAMCLALVMAVTALPYVGKLGFYSDDWYVLWSFHSDAVQHRFGLVSALHYDPARPVQGLYLGLLFSLFGLRPLGYHVTNTAVLAAAIPLFYWLLIRMRVDRASAFGAAALLIVLPQLSTVRVWYLTFQIPLSMVAALASLHCQLSFARSGKAGWAIGAAVAAVVSVGAYEIFAPLIAAFPIALIWAQWRGRFREPMVRRSAAALLTLVALLASLVIVKYAVSARPQAPNLHRYVKGLIQLVRPDYDWRTDYALNIFAAAEVQFWWPMAGLGRGLAALASGKLAWPTAVAAGAAAIIALWRIHSARGSSAPAWTSGRLLLLGLTAFVLGHATFVIVPAMSFSPTGMANRTLVAAALGVALIFIAVARYVASGRAAIFSAAVTIAVLFGTLRIEQIELYWSEAPAIQQRVLASAAKDLRDVPEDSAVMLNGVCPYHGPAVIFEAPWDISGALGLATGKSLHGDAVSPRMRLRRDGLATSIYGEPAFYAFGPKLFVYDPRRHSVVPLRDLAAAQRYFGDPASRTECPRGYVGQGVLI